MFPGHGAQWHWPGLVEEAQAWWRRPVLFPARGQAMQRPVCTHAYTRGRSVTRCSLMWTTWALLLRWDARAQRLPLSLIPVASRFPLRPSAHKHAAVMFPT